MIERTQAFKTSDGETHPSLETAKLHELKLLVADKETDPDGKLSGFFATSVVTHTDRVLDILSTTETSKPRARKINGGTKKRASRAAAQAEAIGAAIGGPARQ